MSIANRHPTLFALFALVILSMASGSARAKVERVEVQSRGVFAEGQAFGAVGPYEVITGTLHYAIDPTDPANRRVVDLHLAPQEPDGKVRFSGDFVLLKPVDLTRGNHRLLYDVNNRGGLVALYAFNDGAIGNRPRDRAHAGNGFLLEAGYSVLWSAWNWDVLPGRGRLQIDLPVASAGGQAITGRVAAEIAPLASSRVMPMVWGNSRGYAPADWDDPEATLTLRENPDGRRTTLPRGQWRFVAPRSDDDPVAIALDPGFAPGHLYELVYTAKDPRVVGLGLTAIRDAIAYFRFERADRDGGPNPLAAADGAPDPQHALIFGASQSGRVIQHMLWQALHRDEAGRLVFDGALVHVAGAGKGSFNHRFAQTTRHQSHWEDHLYPADVFPFTNAPQRDPVTGRDAGLMDLARAHGAVPLVFHTITSTEYWTRAASLLHSGVTGDRDLPPDPRTRIYFIAGAQHIARGIVDRGDFGHCSNPADYRPVLRALLAALDAWVADGTAPPDNAIPRIATGTLGGLDDYRADFPAVAGIALPSGHLRPLRLDHGPRFASEGIADRQPPQAGVPYETLVPMPDADGIDLGGIRLPAIAAPLGSHMGWNLRTSGAGAWQRLGRWEGSFLPFAATRAAADKRGDSRKSLKERYVSRQDYLSQVAVRADNLVAQRFLLRRDVAGIVSRAGRLYDRLMSGALTATCGTSRD